MLKVKDLKKILEDLPEDADIAIEDDNGEVYDCCAEVRHINLTKKIPYLVIAKE